MEYVNKKGEVVPRTSEILKYIQDNEGISEWANFLGFKRIKYKDELSNISDIGIFAHEKINLYINKMDEEVKPLPLFLKNKGDIAYSGLKRWWDDISKCNDVNVIKSEYSIVGEKYGGTLDLLVSINGDIYLVDFKTSSKVKLTHFIQLVAYKNLLKEVDSIDNIKGLIVINSDRNKYEDYQETIIETSHHDFIDKCTKLFNSAIILNHNYNECKECFKDMI